MNVKEKIENNLIIWLLSVLLTGFLAGIGTYKAILEIAGRVSVPKDDYIHKDIVAKDYITKTKYSECIEANKEWGDAQKTWKNTYQLLIQKYNNLQSEEIQKIEQKKKELERLVESKSQYYSIWADDKDKSAAYKVQIDLLEKRIERLDIQIQTLYSCKKNLTDTN